MTENILRRVQEQEKSSGESLLISVLTKLYQNLEVTEEAIESLEKNLDIKSIFAILINALSQVELLSHNLSEPEIVEPPKKSESEKMKNEM